MRGRTGRALPAALAGLLGAALLVGCSGDEPTAARLTPTPTTSSPTSGDPSPTPTTPEQQVEAAVRTYYAELTRAAQTQDTDVLATLMTRGCPCFNVVRGIRAGRADGMSSPDAAWSVKSIAVALVESRTASAEVIYKIAPYDVLARDGSVVRHFDAQRGHVELSMVRADDDAPWIIGNLKDLEA